MYAKQLPVDGVQEEEMFQLLCKMLPASVELARAVALDERAELGLPQQLEDVVDAQIEAKPVGKPTLADVVAAESVEVSQ